MRQQGSVDEDAVSCKEHSDCSFFDCQGECDKILGKCRDKVANNNLQVVFQLKRHLFIYFRFFLILFSPTGTFL